MRRPRIGIVMTELGIHSEIWAMRQIEHFERIEPVLFAWSIREDAEIPEGVETHLFSTPFSRPTDWLTRLGWRLGTPSSVLPPKSGIEDVRRTLLSADLDGIFAHFAWNAMRVAAAVGERLPIVSQVHGRDVSKFLSNRAYRNALARTLPRLHHVAAVGSCQIVEIAPLGLGSHSIIPCGSPFGIFSQGPLPERSAGEPIRFLSVGRIAAEKGVLDTLAAFEKVVQLHPNAEWTCTGAGDQLDLLRERAARSPAADRIRIPGRIPEDEKIRLLQTSHVFLQHSRSIGGWIEGFGVSLTEAGGAGLPLIATRIGGIVDQVQDGVNGFLHPEADIDAQAKAMLRLAEDEPLRRRMGAEARRIAETFDSRRLSLQLEDRILEAVAVAGAPAAS